MKSAALPTALILPLSLALLAHAGRAQGSDSCSTAQVVSGAGPHAFDLTSATTGTDGQAGAACQYNGSMSILTDVWFRWTAPSTDFFVVSTCLQTSVDTKLAVYSGTTCPPGQPTACSDDWGGVQALALFLASSGSTYLIQIGTPPGGTTGTGTFRVLPVPSSGDECGSPAAVTGTGVFAFDNTLASTGTQGQSNPGCVPVPRDVWYSWTAPITGMAHLDTCGQTPSDTNLAVYAGMGCPGATSLACDDDGCGLQSILQWPVTGGASYMLQIGGTSATSGSYGTFLLEVTPVPANDSCASPAIANPGGAQYDNTTATTGTQGQTNPCGQIERDLWFTWTASVTGTASIDTCFQTSVNTSLAVYAGTGCPVGTSLACNDNGCGGDQSEVTIPVTAGTTYTIQIGSSPGNPGGPASFSIIETPGGGGPIVPFCFPGAGTIACPCANPPAGPAQSCNNFGQFTGGASLVGSGIPSLSADSLLLSATGENNTALTVFWGGNVDISPGFPNGAGVRCIAVNLKRLYKGNASGGAIARPGMADPRVHIAQGGIVAGNTRYYYNTYRDPNAAGPCGNSSSTINTTNAVAVTWTP